MADDATPASESDPAGAPGQKHLPLVIEGEATELHAAEEKTSPSEAPTEFGGTESPQPPEEFAPSDTRRPRRGKRRMTKRPSPRRKRRWSPRPTPTLRRRPGPTLHCAKRPAVR